MVLVEQGDGESSTPAAATTADPSPNLPDSSGAANLTSTAKRPTKSVTVVLPEEGSNGGHSGGNGSGNRSGSGNPHSGSSSAADAHRAADENIERQKRLEDEQKARKQQQQQQHQSQHQKRKTSSKTGDNPIIPAAIDFSTMMGENNGDQAPGSPHPASVSSNNSTGNGNGNSNSNQSKNNQGRIQLGICAMDKKARSKPMAEILSRLDENLFRVVFFGDDLILNRPIQEWPANIDVLIAFYSKGYPLQKAKEYVKLRNPVCINDLDMQERLQDRRMVYDLLEASGIDVPRHVFLSQDGYKSTGSGDGNKEGETTVREFDDHIEINGVSIHKPFVEKPVDADDHNIAIYYPTSAGGGCKKLFRKIGNRSSEFYPDIHEIRRDGSYVYEEFVETQGTDVKMYTVGPDYGHAEARKSPTVDGKVQRNADGKELRFPVILTLSEKEIARRIVLQFKQFVCGFDLLRVQEGHAVVSYCCDVNGFSFVKNSRKYYDDCAQILTEHMLAIVKPEEHNQFSTLEPLVTEVADVAPEGFMNPLQRVARLLTNNSNNDGTNQSHSDTVVSDENIETRSHKSMVSTDNDPTLLEEGAVPVRQIPRELISEPASLPVSRDVSCEDFLGKLGPNGEFDRHHVPSSHNSSIRSVDSTYIHNHGSKNSLVNMHQEELRCVIAVVRHADRTPKEKLKLNTAEPIILEYFRDHSEGKLTKDLKIKAKTPMTEFLAAVRKIIVQYEQKEELRKDEQKILWKFNHMRDVLERWKFSGLNRKLQLKPKKITTDEKTGKKTLREVQLILKWGGDLTKLGENQAIQLGQQFRHSIYPDSPGGGVLRLHSTFRHDLKIKTSDEGRVMKTAAAFAKGLLDLEGDIPPILVSLVHKEKGSMHMLDPSGDKDVKLELDECKEKISQHLQEDIDWRDMTEEDRIRLVGPPEVTSLRDALAKIGNPRKTLQTIYQTMGTLIEELEEMLGRGESGDEKASDEGDIQKGDSEDADAQLSGVKLYKGETLLELTERWRFIYTRLYDAETDTFDLSRIPDVLDNVRFDVLHNPHLGLTSILHKLYSLAKDMADTVVPQEYGTTLAEKRSVGIKVCSSLLEKIRFDLHIARTDNKTDMRYMINMDYSADLPITTMGRRIRTRLYFTSESHLHTLINVLRFAANTDAGGSSFSGTNCSSPVLSPFGFGFLNESKEVCYLTQVVIRLFEDTGRRMSDPRRYRVEILFSAGATGTPIHQCKSTKETDATRLDTEPLVAVGREGLTCQEVEAFFDSIIAERGQSDGNHDVDAISEHSGPPKTPMGNPIDSDGKNLPTPKTVNTNSVASCATESQKITSDEGSEQNQPQKNDGNLSNRNNAVSSPPNPSVRKQNGRNAAEKHTSNREEKVRSDATRDSSSSPPERSESSRIGGARPSRADEDDHNKAVRDHQLFYLTIATTALVMGVGCLVLATGLTGNPRNRRHFSHFSQR